MVRRADDRPDALHEKTLEIVENAVEEGDTPVVRVRVIMDHPDIDVTKPTIHSRIDDLVEWGELDRMTVGRAFVLWPADKYEDMAERLDELTADKEYLERRVEELEKEKEEAQEEAVEARARKEAAEQLEEQAALSSGGFLAPDFPTLVPDDLELRWRIRAKAWRRTLSLLATGITFLFLIIAGLFWLGEQLFAVIPVLQESSVNSAVGIFGVMLILLAVLFVWYLLAQLVALVALRSPPFAGLADTIARPVERFGGAGVPGEGDDAPIGTDRALAEEE